mmetsp:Transcript_70280/g.164603  ORF Transcript_70280/g.164603 Transcript_70280/m.164603 type:complete len:235 (-) Transcript_70280:167-871(-)
MWMCCRVAATGHRRRRVCPSADLEVSSHTLVHLKAPLPHARQYRRHLQKVLDHHIHCRVSMLRNIMQQRGFTCCRTRGSALELIYENGAYAQGLACANILHRVLEDDSLFRIGSNTLQHVLECFRLRLADRKHILHSEDTIVREECAEAQFVQAAQSILARRVCEHCELETHLSQAVDHLELIRVWVDEPGKVTMICPELAQIFLLERLGQSALLHCHVESFHRGVITLEILIS